MENQHYSRVIRLMPKPVSHDARRKIMELTNTIDKYERALQRIVDIAPDDRDSGAAVLEIARGALYPND